MAAPVYEDNGGIWGFVSNSTNAYYPGTVNENDILIIQMMSANGNDDHVTPSGFTKITSIAQSTNATYSWYWKRATGSETGSVICIRGSSDGIFAVVMSRWSGAVTTGTPFEAETALGRGIIRPFEALFGLLHMENQRNLLSHHVDQQVPVTGERVLGQRARWEDDESENERRERSEDAIHDRLRFNDSCLHARDDPARSIQRL